jgi:hypothetical protein
MTAAGGRLVMTTDGKRLRFSIIDSSEHESTDYHLWTSDHDFEIVTGESRLVTDLRLATDD